MKASEYFVTDVELISSNYADHKFSHAASELTSRSIGLRLIRKTEYHLKCVIYLSAARTALTKLSNFNSWGYEERRGYLHTTKDYYFFLEYLNGTKFNKLCIDPGSDCVAWNTSTNLVQESRLLIHNGSITRMVLYVYQQP